MQTFSQSNALFQLSTPYLIISNCRALISSNSSSHQATSTLSSTLSLTGLSSSFISFKFI